MLQVITTCQDANGTSEQSKQQFPPVKRLEAFAESLTNRSQTVDIFKLGRE
jgi:hypothetical protein